MNSVRVGSSCSISGTRRNTLVINPMIRTCHIHSSPLGRGIKNSSLCIKNRVPNRKPTTNINQEHFVSCGFRGAIPGHMPDTSIISALSYGYLNDCTYNYPSTILMPTCFIVSKFPLIKNIAKARLKTDTNQKS